MALAGIVASVAAPGAAAVTDPIPVAEALPERDPPVKDAYDGEWQVGEHVIPLMDADDYDPAAHRLTAIVADSTVNFHDARWLDATITRSEGELVLPLVADGPLWDYSVDGSVLTQANSLFPINRVINLNETPDRLIIAQGVNNASPVWHNGWNSFDARDFDTVVAVAGAGVDCIVIVTPGYKTGPGDPDEDFAPASAAERAELDEAALWMRLKAFTDPRFVLADWHALSVSRPEWWFNDVHTDDDGSDQYEALITRAARRCPDPGAWPAPTPAVSTKLIEAAYEDFLHATEVTERDLRYWRESLAGTGYRSTPLFAQLTKDDGFSRELIVALYQQLLRRDATDGDVSYWRPDVESQATTIADLAQGLMASREFSTVAGSGSAAFVTWAYRSVLDRLPSTRERDYWVGQLAAGSSKGTVGRAIFDSAESRDRRSAALATRYLQRRLTRVETAYGRAVLGASGGNDVALAIALAKLPEYRRTAQTR